MAALVKDHVRRSRLACPGTHGISHLAEALASSSCIPLGVVTADSEYSASVQFAASGSQKMSAVDGKPKSREARDKA